MNRLNKGIAAAVMLLCGLALTSLAAPEPIDDSVRQLLLEKVVQLPEPLSNAANIDPSLLLETGKQQVMVKLKSPPVAMMAKEMSQNERMSHKAMVEGEQSAFMKRTETSSNEIACVQTVLNAVFLDIDASEVGRLAEDPDVESLLLVNNYQKQLSETVPYIGATIVQNEGYDGTGSKVAIIDDGIDYTHAAFGGEGTVEAYNAAIKDPTIRDGLFPTAKVVEGIDFVGEIWPNGPLMVDDDPIDAFGHGTAVADIAGGKDGVAPGCDLYAVKVCSATATGCSGVAMVQALEYVLDPNQDGDMSDAMDVVNISIGTSYRTPFDDAVSQAVNAVSALGVLVVGSAGNEGDKPYITGTSASARSSLSVANTQIPSVSLQVLNVENENYPAAFFTWSVPPEAAITGEVQYGDGLGGNLLGCEPFESDSLTGKVVLVDRGECNFSLKVRHVTQGGGLACVVGMVNEDPPFAGGDGGDRPIGVPGYMISLADADAIKATLPGGIATIDPNDVLPLAMTMDPSSSRGPQNDPRNLIKPEIGAPGSSTAALVGTGTDTFGFSGTSGASPMVAGCTSVAKESRSRAL